MRTRGSEGTYVADTLAPFHVSSAHHVSGDHPRIGLITVRFVHDGHIQTLQARGQDGCDRQRGRGRSETRARLGQMSRACFTHSLCNTSIFSGSKHTF